MRQITPSKTNVIEKIIRDSSGRLVRATFCVYENGGHIKARLISASLIEEKSTSNEILLLNCFKTDKKFENTFVLINKTVSPYSDLNILYSGGSKPRAPTR